MHNDFVSREHSTDINRKNEKLFNRLQEIHKVSVLTRFSSVETDNFDSIETQK